MNVKPSVMKPAVHVKPGQKRRGAEWSAVAAVKPLNSASTVLEESLQEKACKDRQVGARTELSMRTSYLLYLSKHFAHLSIVVVFDIFHILLIPFYTKSQKN